MHSKKESTAEIDLDRIRAIPEHVLPVGVVYVGYPAEKKKGTPIQVCRGRCPLAAS
jgi:hypothetical protein